MEDTLAQFIELRNDVLNLYSDAKIISSFRKLVELEKMVLDDNNQLKEFFLDHDEISKIYRSSKLTFQTIRKEYEEVHSLLERFNTEECWDKVLTNKNGTKTMFKKNSDSPLFTVRVDGTIETNIFNVLAILLEIDLYTRWVPTAFGAGLKEVHVFKDIDRFRKLAHFLCGLPFPFTNRDVVIYGYGVDLLEEENKILAVVRSIDDEVYVKNEDDDDDHDNEENEYKQVQTILGLLKEGLEIPPEVSKYVRVSVKEGGFLLTPLNENACSLSFIFTADPKMSYIPSYLINWGLKFSANYAIQTLKTTSLTVDHDEIYQERMRNRPEVYQYLRNRLDEYNHKKKDGKKR